jgi:flagellar hook assembly protein FlgD
VSAFVFVPGEETHRVQVSIYDVQGRLVRTIFEQRIAGGTHTVDWDRRNSTGALVGSGVYFIQMSVAEAGFVRTRKLAVFR